MPPPLGKGEKRMLILVGISVAVFLVVDPYYLWRKKPTPAPADKEKPKPVQTSPTAVSASSPASSAGTVPTSFQPVRPRQDYPTWGRDPFLRTRASFEAEQELSSRYKLIGISVKATDRYALINNQVVREGDALGSFIVQSIRSDRVLLSHNDKVYVLTLGE
ncbi:MAG: hypothetical protein ACK4OO_03090 [bacterium]